MDSEKILVIRRQTMSIILRLKTGCQQLGRQTGGLVLRAIFMAAGLVLVAANSPLADEQSGKTTSPIVNAEMAVQTAEPMLGSGKSRSHLEPFGLGVSNLLISKRWPYRTIPYRFADGFTDKKKKEICEGIELWNSAHSNGRQVIHLAPQDAVLAVEPKYRGVLEFYPDSKLPADEQGCYSSVGYLGKYDPQRVVISEWCTAPGIAHEVGHAIGLDHEHQRWDRALYIDVQENTFLPDNLGEELKYQTKIESPLFLSTYGTQYDLRSLMHYQSCDLEGLKPQPNNCWFKLTQRGSEQGVKLQDVGRALAPSQIDAAIVDRIYEKVPFLKVNVVKCN